MRKMIYILTSLVGLGGFGGAVAQTPSGNAQGPAPTQGTASGAQSANTKASTGTPQVGGATADGVEAAAQRLEDWRRQREALKQSASGFQQ